MPLFFAWRHKDCCDTLRAPLLGRTPGVTEQPSDAGVGEKSGEHPGVTGTAGARKRDPVQIRDGSGWPYFLGRGLLDEIQCMEEVPLAGVKAHPGSSTRWG